MTSLVLAGDRLALRAQRLSGALSLREWLAGRWAILFSHPEDFAQEQLEVDRWISVLSEAFRVRGVAAVTLARAERDPDEGWLGRLAALGPDCATLDLGASAVSTDFTAGALRANIARSGPRFALIMDADARCRRTLRYRPPAETPSPLELVGWAGALRKRDHIWGRLPARADIHGAESIIGSLAACDQPAAAAAGKAAPCGFPPQVQ